MITRIPEKAGAVRATSRWEPLTNRVGSWRSLIRRTSPSTDAVSGGEPPGRSDSDVVTGPADLGARIRAVMSHLSPSERRVAHLVEQDPARVVQLTVAELAREASTSAATVVRTAKSLGFDGYPQLRYALAAQAGADTAGTDQPRVADIADGDGVEVVLAKLAAFEGEQITATAGIVSSTAVETTAEKLAQARRCCLFGIGASGLVAQDLAQKMTRIGLTAFVHTEQDAAVVAASLLESADMALAFSHSGETPGSFEPLRQARDSGAYTAAITGNPRSTVTRYADQVLATAGREFGRRPAAVGSRTSQLLIVDTLFVRLTQLVPATMAALDKTHQAIGLTRSRSR